MIPLPRRRALAATTVAAVVLLAAGTTSGFGRTTVATVVLGGDVHAEGGLAGDIAAGRDPFAGVRAVLRAADVTVTNLETPTAVGTPADKSRTFAADAALLPALAAAGVDAVTLANNHALDQGRPALAATVAAAEAAGLAVVGAGPDARTASAPALFDTPAGTIAVLGLATVRHNASWAAGATGAPGWGVADATNPEAAAVAVRAASRLADHVVVTVHWGSELRECPSVAETRLADLLVAAGADVVAGHHPHVLQGIDVRDGAVVAFSLGNLAFAAATPDTRRGGLLRVTFDQDGMVAHEVVPLALDRDGRPTLADGLDSERAAAVLRARSPGGGTCPAGVWDGADAGRTSGGARSDDVAQHADSLDLQLDHVARGQVRVPVATTGGPELEDAARADGSRPDDVARTQPRVA